MVTVREKGSGVPVEEATVVLGPEEVYDTTNQQGQVRFEAVDKPATIKALAAGYEPLVLTVRKDQAEYTLYLEPVHMEGEGLEVVAERIKEKTSKLTLSKEELLNSPGSQGDPLKTVTSMPGVVTAIDGTGVVYMRGSGANENIVWVNRAPVDYLYHWDGIQSTINPALVQDMNIFLGGFPVEYGDFLGGAIDVQLRTPRTDRMRYKVDISTYASSFLLEGPVGSVDGKDSFFLAGRRSYIDLLISPDTFNDAFEDEDVDDPDQITQVPEFYDFQGLYHYQLDRGDLELYCFGAGDELAMELRDSAASDPQLQGDLDSKTSYETVGLNWNQAWSSRLDQVMVLSYSHSIQETHLGSDDSGEPFYVVFTDNHLLWQPELRWQQSDDQRFFLGMAMDYHDVPLDYYFSRAPTEDDIDYDLTSKTKYHVNKTLYAHGFAPYIKHRMQWTDRLTTIMGLRYTDISVSGGYHTQDYSPRAAVEYAISEDTLLSASVGRFVQMPEPDTILKDIGNPSLEVAKSDHRIVGVEHHFSPLYSLKAEVYHKEMTDLVVAIDENSPPDNFANEGEGEAYGFDLFLKRKQADRKMGWLSLSCSKSERTNNITGVTRDFSGDRPLALTAVWGQPFPGRGHKWRWSFRLQLQSGVPYTKVIGRHREDPGDPDSRWIPEYGEHNGERTPLHYRLDLRFDREFLFNEWKMKFYIDIQNATNHDNIQGYDYGSEYQYIDNPREITGMPIFPFFGIEATF